MNQQNKFSEVAESFYKLGCIKNTCQEFFFPLYNCGGVFGCLRQQLFTVLFHNNKTETCIIDINIIIMFLPKSTFT